MLVGMGEVEPDQNARRDLWRLLTAENAGRHGAVAGVADYHPAEDVSAPSELGAAHERAEVYFVLTGTGELHVPDGAHALAVGDAFLIPGGVPHKIVGTAGNSLRAFYVSLKEPAG